CNPIEAIRDITGGGADFTFEAVGNARVLAQAYEACATGGATVAIGLPPPGSDLVINALSVVGHGKRILGSYMGSSVPIRDLKRYLKLYQAGYLPLDEMVTSTLTLDEINEGFDRLRSGEH